MQSGVYAIVLDRFYKKEMVELIKACVKVSNVCDHFTTKYVLTSLFVCLLCTYF